MDQHGQLMVGRECLDESDAPVAVVAVSLGAAELRGALDRIADVAANASKRGSRARVQLRHTARGVLVEAPNAH